MAVFRVLLNLLVILVLPLAGGLPEALAFSLAAGGGLHTIRQP